MTVVRASCSRGIEGSRKKVTKGFLVYRERVRLDSGCSTILQSRCCGRLAGVSLLA